MHKQFPTIANYLCRVDNTVGITINRGSAEGQKHKNGTGWLSDEKAGLRIRKGSVPVYMKMPDPYSEYGSGSRC
jgi:hypothetical protein